MIIITKLGPANIFSDLKATEQPPLALQVYKQLSGLPGVVGGSMKTLLNGSMGLGPDK